MKNHRKDSPDRTSWPSLHGGYWLALLIVTVAVFANSLPGEFMMDDYGILLEDPKAHSLNSLGLHFVPGADAQRKLEPVIRDVYYRPLTHVLYTLSYLAFGREAFGYHVFNLILYYCTAVLFYWFVFIVSREAILSFLAALLFIIHPINGVLVNYITASVFSAQLLAMLGSLLVFLSAQEGRFLASQVLASQLLYIMAVLFHESAVVLPLYSVLCLMCVKKFNFKKAITVAWPYAVTLMAYLVFRIFFVSLKSVLFDKIGQFDMNFWQYLATFTRLAAWYLKKFLLLDGIVLIWSTPVLKEHLLVWGVGFACLLLPCLYAVFECWKRDSRSLALAWFMMGFIPVAGGCLFNPALGLMIEPHWLAFASLGVFLLLAIIFLTLRRAADARLWFILMLLVTTALSLSSYWYNDLWRTEKSYCRWWLQNLPAARLPLFYLGRAHMNDGEFPAARRYFSKVLTGSFQDFEIYNNIALMDASEGNVDAAFSNYEKALALNPRSSMVHTNLGVLFSSVGDDPRAREHFGRAVALDPNLIEARLNLAGADWRQGNVAEAFKEYEKVLSVDPAEDRAFLPLAQISLAMDRRSEALDFLQRLLISGRDPVTLTAGGGLAAAYRPELARALFEKALKLDPRDGRTYLELGKLYGNLDRFDEAISCWRKGQQLAPQENSFADLIRQAERLKRRSAN